LLVSGRTQERLSQESIGFATITRFQKILTEKSAATIKAAALNKPFQAAYTLGFPNIGLQGFAPKLAKGEIASLSGAGDDARYFRISVSVQPGNSGLRRAVVDSDRNSSGGTFSKFDHG